MIASFERVLNEIPSIRSLTHTSVTAFQTPNYRRLKGPDVRLGVQLYTLRDCEQSFPELVDRIAEAGYDGVQFADGFHSLDDDVATVLDDAGLDVAGAHIGLEDVEDDLASFEPYWENGCTEFVVPSYDDEAFQSREGAEEAGQRLAALADDLADDGLGVHYHNHTFEFTPLGGGETTFDAFAEAAEGVRLEIDTGLANHGGEDPVALLERYGDRVDLVHFTDSRPDDDDAPHADIGTGCVDVEGCIAAAEAAGAEWTIFEHGLTDNPIASMNAAARTLRPLLS
jgi:sugar phosphate isomerase/epimerase